VSSDRIVHVIDDDAGVRRALAFLLGSAGFPVRVYESAVMFLSADPMSMSGVVVTDIGMPEIDGMELQRQLKAQKFRLPIIMITGNGDIRMAVEALKAGAADFIEKPFDDDVLIATINAAFDKDAASGDHDAFRREVEGRLGSLSARERQVLDHVIAGHPNKITAHLLGLSSRTVEVYRINVKMKMQARSTSELIRMVLTASGTGSEN
jgi:two-component system response regulator FixJ